MKRAFVLTALLIGAAAVALVPDTPMAQQAKAAVKAGKGEKVCRVKMIPSGENRSWVCKAAEPCCVWHEINYVKCGSVTFGCL